MARTNNALTKGTSGAIGKDVVFRVRNGKTFQSKYPDMSNVVPSQEQLKYKSIFAQAVEYAQEILKDPAKKKRYKVKEGHPVYHTAIRDFMKGKAKVKSKN